MKAQIHIQIIKQFHAPSPTPFETDALKDPSTKQQPKYSKKDDALRLSNPVKTRQIR
jgi:hypothetical protein